MPRIMAGDVELEYDIHGHDSAEALLLIMGLGAQMTRWSDGFIAALTDRGFRVVRFDNRDVGLSRKFDDAGLPDMPAIMAALGRGEVATAPYNLSDMAADAVNLLTALEIDKAHIVGASMGGMIAQLVAADHGDRTLSLTSIMSTTGKRGLPPATPEAIARLNTPAPDPNADLEAYIAHSIVSARTMGSPGWPATEAELREQAIAAYQRSWYPIGFLRQYAAILTSPPRNDKLAAVTAPSLVIHGVDDPLVPVDGGRDTAASIPGSRLLEIPGMGHDVPPALYDLIADSIAENAGRVTA